MLTESNRVQDEDQWRVQNIGIHNLKPLHTWGATLSFCLISLLFWVIPYWAGSSKIIIFGDNWSRFLRTAGIWMPILWLSHQCKVQNKTQSTDSHLWKITHRSHPFLIHQPIIKEGMSLHSLCQITCFSSAYTSITHIVLQTYCWKSNDVFRYNS